MESCGYHLSGGGHTPNGNYNPPPPPFPQNNDGIVGLLWMNQYQHCVGGGEWLPGEQKIHMLAKV